MRFRTSVAFVIVNYLSLFTASIDSVDVSPKRLIKSAALRLRFI